MFFFIKFNIYLYNLALKNKYVKINVKYIKINLFFKIKLQHSKNVKYFFTQTYIKF